jgi:hypothetical protein
MGNNFCRYDWIEEGVTRTDLMSRAARLRLWWRFLRPAHCLVAAVFRRLETLRINRQAVESRVGNSFLGPDIAVDEREAYGEVED